VAFLQAKAVARRPVAISAPMRIFSRVGRVRVVRIRMMGIRARARSMPIMRPGNVSFEGRENSSVYTCYDPGEDLDWFQGPVPGHGYPRPVCCDGSYAAEYDDVVASEDEYLNADDGIQGGFPESERAELEQRTCD